MITFFKNSLRGGITQHIHKKVIANNKYLSDYNENEPNVSLLYVDANNLYSHSLSAYLPVKDFQWMTREEINELTSIDEKTGNIKLLNVPYNSNIGYVSEVDVTIPVELHDKFNELPFFGENIIQEGEKCKKFILSLHDKKNYVTHYRMLQLTIDEGVHLKSINRGVKFVQNSFRNRHTKSLTLHINNFFPKKLIFSLLGIIIMHDHAIL